SSASRRALRSLISLSCSSVRGIFFAPSRSISSPPTTKPNTRASSNQIYQGMVVYLSGTSDQPYAPIPPLSARAPDRVQCAPLPTADESRHGLPIPHHRCPRLPLPRGRPGPGGAPGPDAVPGEGRQGTVHPLRPGGGGRAAGQGLRGLPGPEI